MKEFLLAVCLLLATSAISAQSSLPKGLNVNGVALGAKYDEVVKKLNKPTRDVTAKKIDECIGANIRTLFYPGLKLELADGEVFAFEITSGSWNVSGVKIGDTSTQVQKLFGTRGRRVEKKPTLAWYYDMSDDSPGSSNFFFRAGKVYKISSTFEMC